MSYSLHIHHTKLGATQQQLIPQLLSIDSMATVTRLESRDRSRALAAGSSNQTDARRHLRASIMNDMEPAESDVGEREIMREKETGVSRYAG